MPLLFLCSSVFQKRTSTKKYNACYLSSLAMARELVSMQAQMPAIKRMQPTVSESDSWSRPGMTIWYYWAFTWDIKKRHEEEA